MKKTAELVSNRIRELIKVPKGEEKQVVEAMLYSSLNGGKRLRPYLLMESAKLFDVEEGAALTAAVALELVHCFSLIHDDLPCMDDDDLRRGQPTCHKKYDEATAVLAGDALLAKAFEAIANSGDIKDTATKLELISELAAATGSAGMIGGQMMDILAENGEKYDLSQITKLQRMKTGALIAFATEAAAILGHAKKSEREALRKYALNVGLAFQIADDILDVIGDQETLGKAVRKDDKLNKATFVSLMGLSAAKKREKELVEEAIGHLACFGEKGKALRDLARFIIERAS